MPGASAFSSKLGPSPAFPPERFHRRQHLSLTKLTKLYGVWLVGALECTCEKERRVLGHVQLRRL
jgi:hypothetical protein